MTTPTMLFPAPDRSGVYRPRISINDGAMTISVDYVAKKWLPYSLFGETVHTKQFSLDATAVGRPLSVDNTQNGLLLTSGPLLENGSQVNNVLFSQAWGMPFRSEAHRKIVAALHGTPVAKNSRALKIMAAVIAGYVVLAAMAAKMPQQQVATAPAVSSAEARANLEAIARKASMSAPTAETKAAMQEAFRQTMGDVMASSGKIAQENAKREGPLKLTSEVMASAAAFQYKQGAPNGKQIVVWSDPMCSHCHDFDNNILPKLPDTVGVTILPVSFRDYSRIYAGHALCGINVQEKVARWKDLMLPEPKADISAKCDEGIAKVDSNSTIFVRAGLTVTPTVTSIDGQQVFAGNLENLAEVTAWVNELK